MNGIGLKKQSVYFIIFTILSIIFGLMGYFFPTIFSLIFSFFKYNGITTPIFTGLSNYVHLLNDNVFWTSLKNNFLYALFVVPATTVISLLVAVGLNRKVKIIIPILRTIYLLPLVTSSIAISIVWMWIYNGNFGLLNQILSIFNIQGPNWLLNPKFSLLSIAIVNIWAVIGYYSIIFLSGLQSIPSEYYEAAQIDGASSFQKFIYITLPLISPMTFFVVILSTIGSFQLFDYVYMMTNGGPGYSSYSLVYYIYLNGFSYMKMGYGMAISMVLFVILLCLTAVQFLFQRKWVFYK
ncbi:MAG: carbohydrate ABC transporter permease [Thermoplasmata archaeon]